jgi:hypothetical protein
MKVIFLDFDGVLNSHQSFNFWHNKRDQQKWENELYEEWQGSLKEYMAQEFCPIALNNMENVIRSAPEVKVVISSTWRLGETVESLRAILAPAKLLSQAVIDVTPRFPGKERGLEIQNWLDRHPEVTDYVIIDDDSDMLDSQKDHFVHTNTLHGFQYGDMMWALKILGEPNEYDLFKGYRKL